MGRKKTGSTFACAICQANFYVPRCQIERRRPLTCSYECFGELKARERIRTCVQCGKEFSVHKQRKATVESPYCSKACDGVARRKTVAASCSWCKTDLERNPWQVKQNKKHFCDITCVREWKQRYGTDRGRGAFTAIQKREWMDDHCKKCGTTENLQMDHIIPKFAGGSNTRDNAQTLCRICNREKFWLVDQYKYSPDRPHSARLDF